MRQRVVRALVLMLVAISVFSVPKAASAAESLPEMQWTPVQAEAYRYPLTTSPEGDVTIGCGTVVSDSPQDVVTWGANGTEVRRITRTPQVDGKDNCIYQPVVDKNGDLYGRLTSGYLYAYSGNTLKWKYTTSCTYSSLRPVIGADGNIYFINNNGQLVGLTPEVESGTTQPKKMLDVATSNGRCDDELLAYKDGLLRIDYNSKATYYTYGGMQLGSPPTYAGYYPGHTPINAAGRMFYVTNTGSGAYQGMKLNAYDPTPNTITWTAQESTFGYGVTDITRIYATPDGGAVVHLKRTKIVAGAPSSEKAWALIKVNAHGIKMWDIDLPNADTSGNYVGPQSYVNVDTTGKLVLVRWWSQQLSSSPWQVPFTTVDILNVGTGEAVSPPKIMHGNIATSDGEVYGYRIMTRPVIGPNTVYVPVLKCTTACYGDRYTKIYPIKVSGLGLDYPRGAVLAVPSPLKPYSALGDSYASGQGAGAYDANTVTDTNKCYKSYNGFGRILGRDTSNSLTLTNFAACGGSVTDNIDANTTYPGVTQKQDQALSVNTKAVSLTIGGNDIGFGDVLTTCANPIKDCDGAYSLAYNQLGVLDIKLQRVYLDILQKAPNAKVYVLGYPPIVTAGPGCMVGNNGSDYPIFSESRKQKAVDLANSLNSTIKTNVDIIRTLNNYDQRLKFVDATASGSPFIGHDVCSSEPYVNGLILPPGDTSESFHPNIKGQNAYASLLMANMG